MPDQDAPKPDSESQNDANPSAEHKNDAAHKDNPPAEASASKDADKPDKGKPDSKKPAEGKKKSGIVKKLAIVAGVLSALAIIGYFVATSAFFVKAFVVPRVAKMLNAEIKLNDASISPFSQVSFTGVEVTATGEELLANVGSVKARYSLMDIIGGKINVSEVTVESPSLQLIIKEDGTTNLDPILAALATDEPPPPGETPNLSIRNVNLKNATVKVIQRHKGGAEQVIEVKNVNLSLDLLGNGQASKIAIAAALGVQLPNPADKLAANFNGSYEIELNADLMPLKLNGKTTLAVTEATGALAPAQGFGTEIDTALTPTDLSETVRFLQDGKQLGQIKLSGPFNSQDLSADLKLAVDPIDKSVLNIVGAMMGMDFESTVISYESQIKIAPAATKIDVSSKLNLNQFSISAITAGKKGPATPPMNVSVSYNVGADLAGQTATLSSLAVSGSNAKGKFLSGDLSKPISVSFGDAFKATGDAAYSLSVDGFELAPWRSIAGDSVPEGSLSAKLDVTADSTGENVTAIYGVKLSQNGADSLTVNGKLGLALVTMVADLASQITVDLSKLKIPGAPEIPGEPMTLNVDTALKADINAGSATLNRVNFFANVGSSRIVDGKLNKPTDVSWSNGVKISAGAAYNLAITNFDLRHAKAIAGDSIPDGVLNLKLAIAADDTGAKVQVNYAGDLAQGGQQVLKTAGDIGVTLATLALDLRTTLDAELSKLQIAGAPLVPAEQNVSMKISMDSNFDGSTFKLKEFKSTFNEGGKLLTSLGAVAEVTLPKGAGDPIRIANTKVQLEPTARAQNILTINGQLTPAALISGNFTLKSDGIDVTPFMDMFMPTNAPATETTASPPAPAPPSNEEPPAIDLPIETFTLDIAIAKFFAREVAVSNYVTKVAIKRSQVNVDPVSLTFNGAPINAKALLNLGVPGYEYDVALKIDRLPIGPLVDTFVPEYRGKVDGQLLTDVGLKGKGTTGANLRRRQ